MRVRAGPRARCRTEIDSSFLSLTVLYQGLQALYAKGSGGRVKDKKGAKMHANAGEF
jgi:hypothetical protein